MQSVTPQNRHVVSVADAFLRVHWDKKSPVLLGYSGGPDSKALLYALLECNIVPAIAHVDHGWREESREEAKLIEQEAKSLGCPFYSTRLVGEKKEDVARLLRQQFFRSLSHQFQAVLLAHTADDLAETVLKRILEGANLPFLGGMQDVSALNGVPYWRPFLTVTKKDILQYLQSRSLSYFDDQTNRDPAYLRARMRTTLFPFLNETFGKETAHNLALLSERARELNEYLEKKTLHVQIHRLPNAIFVDLNGLEKMEQRYIIQKIVKNENIVLSRECLETLLQWLQKKAQSKCLQEKYWVNEGCIHFSLSKLDQAKTK